MFQDFSLFPEAASTVAGRVDELYLFLVGMTAFAATGIFSTLLFFAVRYRRRQGRKATQIEGSIPLEVLWSAVPLALFVFAFGWGAKVYLEVHNRPKDCMQFYVTGKQWMWKIQHPTGQREINALHIPVGEPIELTMISEDVIHDFFVPAFRVKRDVVPGMYTSIWFEATKVGTYHLFCAEYCGTKHSQMIGEVIVMDPADYEQWLSGQPAGADPVESGRLLFENLLCATCHEPGPRQRGPSLAGRFGTKVGTQAGRQVPFDEDYVRSSILDPMLDLSVGFEPVMQTYKGQVTETNIQHLIAYLKSIGAQPVAGETSAEGEEL